MLTSEISSQHYLSFKKFVYTAHLYWISFLCVSPISDKVVELGIKGGWGISFCQRTIAGNCNSASQAKDFCVLFRGPVISRGAALWQLGPRFKFTENILCSHRKLYPFLCKFWKKWLIYHPLLEHKFLFWICNNITSLQY